MGAGKRCNFCNINDLDDDLHSHSEIHRFNHLLWEFQQYRKPLARDKQGRVALKVQLMTQIPENEYVYTNDSAKGKHTLKISSEILSSLDGKLQFKCTITNQTVDTNIIVCHAQKLHPFELFRLVDVDNNLLANNPYPELEPRASYSCILLFELHQITAGIIKIPVSFILKPKRETIVNGTNAANAKFDEKYFNIARSVIVEIQDDEHTESSKEASPFTDHSWTRDGRTVKIIYSSLGKYNYQYETPSRYIKVLLSGLQETKKMTEQDLHELQNLRNILKDKRLTLENYKMYLHTLLWLEEAAMLLALRKYNMENVCLTITRRNMLELVVPGLAEKRPSLIPHDRILIRIHEDHKAYEGIIKYISNSTVTIGDINEEIINIIRTNASTEMDVAFVLGRLPLERQHAGVDNVVNLDIVKNLFPCEATINSHRLISYPLHCAELYNQKISHNLEQYEAIRNIVNCCSRPAPYIVFGPPGTGKTETIVEAILQIKRLTNKLILVCAPANAACDMLARKLKAFCTPKELIRVHSQSRDEVPEDLEDYSNVIGLNPQPDNLRKFRIVVTTLILIGRYSHSVYKPDYIFIDEAAQAIEPEADVAIGLNRTAQVVLAGDPKQLGPNICSTVAAEMGLGISLLERLWKMPIYKTGSPHMMTMLIRNYRSHINILEIPNELFYDGKLQAFSVNAANDPLAKINLFPLFNNMVKPPKIGSAIEFCSVYSEEKQEGRSPSFFNPWEVQMVMKYINTLQRLNLGENNVRLNQIGIVTPYVRQVYKIKQKLKESHWEEVEVGTTESFQGREKRVILVSSVRAKKDLLLHDKKYSLGFVRQPNRFNVALTRAESKLIVIGCPLVLQTDKKWLMFMEKCKQVGSYYGAPMAKRDRELRRDIFNRITKVKDNCAQWKH